MDMSDDAAEFRIQLGRRIAEVVAKFATKTAASEAAGITSEQLNRWIAGQVKVPVDGLWRLAAAADIDFCWLCSGKTNVIPIPPSGRAFHERVLRDVLMALADVIATEGVTFEPGRFADLAFDLHDYVVERRAQAGADAADLAGIARLITHAARARR